MEHNYKTISKTSSKIFKMLSDKNKEWFHLNEMYILLPDMSENNIRVHVKRMTDEGLLMRVRGGTYYKIPFERDNKYMPDWHLLAEPLLTGEYYIGYYSALDIHGLIIQPSLNEQIVTNKPVKPTEKVIKRIPFQFIYHNSTHFFGYKKIWINDFNKVWCSDLEKTIIDCLYKPNYAGGIVEIAQAIIMSKNKINYEKLLEYAIKFNSQAVIKRLGFLLELLSIENFITEKLRVIRSNSVVSLEPKVQNTGKILSRWNILQNIDIETIKNVYLT